MQKHECVHIRATRVVANQQGTRQVSPGKSPSQNTHQLSKTDNDTGCSGFIKSNSNSENHGIGHIRTTTKSGTLRRGSMNSLVGEAVFAQKRAGRVRLLMYATFAAQSCGEGPSRGRDQHEQHV